jgi:acyl dehydratase
LHPLRAHNDAATNANKIHNDTVAAQYGFRGGLVPGVTFYTYMIYPMVQSFGEAWLTQGTANVRFAQPFYEGNQVTVSGTIQAISKTGLDLDMWISGVFQ